MNQTTVEPVRLVLDTNIVLDWLVFREPSVALLDLQIAAGHVSLMTHELALLELARVLEYEQLGLSADRRAFVLAAYRARSTLADLPAAFGRSALQLPATFPKCRDSDDDLFLALAYHAKAAALVTRDKALLKLRKRARRFQVGIFDVEQLASLLGEPATSS